MITQIDGTPVTLHEPCSILAEQNWDAARQGRFFSGNPDGAAKVALTGRRNDRKGRDRKIGSDEQNYQLMDEYANKKFIRKKDRRKNPGRTAGRNALLCLGLGALLFAGIPVQAAQETYTNTDFAMDTVVSETLYTSGEDITPEIGSLLREIEETYLSWTDGIRKCQRSIRHRGNRCGYRRLWRDIFRRS